MRDLEEIKRVNSADNVGDKLGADNGNASRLYDRHMLARQTVGIAMLRSKAPWDATDPIDHHIPITTERQKAIRAAYDPEEALALYHATKRAPVIL